MVPVIGLGDSSFTGCNFSQLKKSMILTVEKGILLEHRHRSWTGNIHWKQSILQRADGLGELDI